MLSYDLVPAVTIRGRRVGTLKEASYVIRQYAIDHGDLAGWRLTRLLRNAECYLDGEVAEWALRSWIDQSERAGISVSSNSCDTMTARR
jgi:hypothetical protein